MRIDPAGRENPADNQPGVFQTLGAEEDPREHDKGEDQELFDQRRNPLLVELRLFRFAGQAATQGVQVLPNDERPGGAMPDAGDHHGQEHVPIRAPRTAPAPAQREIEIVLEPGGETDVPAVPEIAQAGGGVRIVEVQHQPKAHELGDAAGHVGVTTEIEVDLPAERHRCQD